MDGGEQAQWAAARGLRTVGALAHDGARAAGVIDSLTQDIDFAYRGKSGSICPFHREDIALCYDGYAVDAHSVDEVMTLPFICGRSLDELCEELDI